MTNKQCLRIRNPLKHDAVLAVYGEAEETGILTMQFVHLQTLMITSFSEELYFPKHDLLQLGREFLQSTEEFGREPDGNHISKTS